MAGETGSKAERISQLQAELDELMNSAEEEVTESLSEAEDSVEEVADTVNEEAKEAHETVNEAEQEVHEAVEETANETAEELGHPELAEEIADHLFRKLEEAGKLPHQHHSPAAPEGVESGIEEAAPVVQEAETVVRDTPPEPQHWYYRKRKFGKLNV